MKAKASLFTSEYQKMLEQASRLKVNCLLCDRFWVYFEGHNNLHNMFSDIKQHLKGHEKK